jgi:hypothetical protein
VTGWTVSLFINVIISSWAGTDWSVNSVFDTCDTVFFNSFTTITFERTFWTHNSKVFEISVWAITIRSNDSVTFTDSTVMVRFVTGFTIVLTILTDFLISVGILT